MIDHLEFRVYGVPKPGGSKRAFQIPTTKRIVIVDACKKNKEWRKEVVDWLVKSGERRLLEGALRLECEFIMPRPKSHYGTGRNIHSLKKGAPKHHLQKPDLTKLLRSTEDALTGHLWKDDCQVVCHGEDMKKRWTNLNEQPGVIVRVEQIEMEK